MAEQYWVWALDRDNMPLTTEGPWGPYDAQTARTYARISATEGSHDRAVSHGKDPRASSFEIMRIYRAGSGEHIYSGGGVTANASSADLSDLSELDREIIAVRSELRELGGWGAHGPHGPPRPEDRERILSLKRRYEELLAKRDQYESNEARPHGGVTANPAGVEYYDVKFVHKISPSDKDRMGPVTMPDNAFSDRNTLAKALRDAGVLHSGDRLSNFRVEGEKVIAFPTKSIWHAIVLTPSTEMEPNEARPHGELNWYKITYSAPAGGTAVTHVRAPNSLEALERAAHQIGYKPDVWSIEGMLDGDWTRL